jgi:hypothetical protein
MTLPNFKRTLSANNPPADLSVYLKALWYEAKDQWDKAHQLIQDLPDKNASWIHAYLHRKEGDTSNADYWYNRANRKRPAISLTEEWEQIANTFLADPS